MATIVALCPYCRRGGVRAPERIIGSVATCPKCGSQFTIVPKEDAEDLTPGPTGDTRPHAVASDGTETSPVLPPGQHADEPERTDPAFAGSMIALIFFGLGVLATQFPFGRWIGLGLCGAGLLLALVCLLGEGRARWFAAGGTVLNAIAVALLALVPTWLGFQVNFDEIDPARPKGAHSISMNTNDLAVADRTDAGKAVYANSDVRIGVKAFTMPLELTGPNGAIRRTRENVLKLTIGITNNGVERRILLTGWAAGTPGEDVHLTDPSGNAIKVKVLEAGWKPTGFEKSEGVFPGKTAETVLLFEPPASTKTKRIEYLNLDLPGTGVGLLEPIRFKIPGPF